MKLLAATGALEKMKKPVRATRTTIENVLNAHSPDSSNTSLVIAKKATVLAFNSGTLIEAEEGGYYIVQQGEWHRYGDNTLPQVDCFDQLNAVNLTVLKKDIIKDIFRGQKVPEQDRPVVEKTDSPVEASPKRKKKS